MGTVAYDEAWSFLAPKKPEVTKYKSIDYDFADYKVRGAALIEAGKWLQSMFLPLSEQGWIFEGVKGDDFAATVTFYKIKEPKD